MAASYRSPSRSDSAALPQDGAFAALAVALLASAGSAALLLAHHRVLAGTAALVAGAALLGASRAARRSNSRGRLSVLVMDRLFDAAVLAPLAWITREAAPGTCALALFCLGTSFVASYERARGQALGFRGSETIQYRAARVALLVVALLTGRLALFLWIFVIVAGSAVIVRWRNVQRQVRTA